MTHRFRDEWLTRAVLAAKPELAAALEELRKAEAPTLAGGLVAQKHLDEAALGALIEKQYAVAPASPTLETLDTVAFGMVPEKICRQYNLVAFAIIDEVLHVLTDDPLNPDLATAVTAVSGRSVKAFYALGDKIKKLLEEKLNPALTAAQLAQEMAQSQEAALEVVDETPEEKPPEDAEAESGPISALATSIFVNAVRMRASDIHIEQEEARSIVRYRIDGHLRNIMTLPRHIGSGPLVSRIKIMGKMDVSDRRRPLDGRAKIKLDGHEIGLRISTLPTSLGEKVVVRILDKRQAEIPFESLGFRPEVRERLKAILDRSVGLMLVTGPTGSGKTTTLYACINYLKDESSNIVTIEDPVEYKLDGINQVQINDKAGLGFGAVLRSVLRQDPDVVLLGEMRDKETAEIAFQASNTGHFVLSTLHSNDCIATVTRLVQMGIDPYKIASPLSGVSSQRLIRRICQNCRASDATPLPPGLAARAAALGYAPALAKGAGCVQCGQSGFRGRIVVSEFLTVDQDVKSLITSNASETQMRAEAARRGSLLTPADDAVWHLCTGSTSLSETLAFLGGDLSPEKLSVPKPAAPPAPEAPVPSGLIATPVVAAPAPPAPVAASAPPPAPPPAPAPAPLPPPAATPAPASAAPAVPTSATTASLPTASVVPGIAAGGRDVLIVDDEESIRVLMRRLLKSEGYTVREAENGSAALKMIAERMPDLLITDLNMPVLDGVGLIRAVRADLRIWNVPIVILTAVSSSASQALARQMGVDDYLIKPFEEEVLLARVDALLKRAKLRQD